MSDIHYVIKTVCALAFMNLLLCPSYSKAQVIYKSIHTIAGLSRNLSDTTYLGTIDAGMDFGKQKWGTMGLEMSLYKFIDRDYNTLGFGIRPTSQIFFIRHYNYTLFTEAKGGIIYMFPQKTNNNLNFTFVCGLGNDIRISKKNFIRISIDYSHFSNGKRNGANINPTWDGLAIYIGWVYSVN